MSQRLLNSALGVVTLAILTVAVPGAQTKIVPPKNWYSLAQDVELGREAAGEARKQLPLMSDDAVTSYVEDLGRRLVDAIPAELQHSEFQYTFETVNVRDINAFALPGGPMFVNRGMIEAAATEGEVAGVMAHEISHVVLRHGTAQASKASKYQAGADRRRHSRRHRRRQRRQRHRAGHAVRARARRSCGSAASTRSRPTSRARRSWRAPATTRATWPTCSRPSRRPSGGSGPEWLSDHPNPGNRSEYITQEAQALRITNPITDTTKFDRVKAHLKSLPKAPTSEEVARSAGEGRLDAVGGGTTRRPTGNVRAPSSRYTAVHRPAMSSRSACRPTGVRCRSSQRVTFAPDGAYGTVRRSGRVHARHRVRRRRATRGTICRRRPKSSSTRCSRGNPQMRSNGEYRRATIGGQGGLGLKLGNVSEVTKDNETVQLLTTQLRDGSLFYAIAVAPEGQFNDYASTFQRVVDSVQFMR